jgi:hypothetical protein
MYSCLLCRLQASIYPCSELCQRDELLHGLFHFWSSYATTPNCDILFPFLRTSLTGVFTLAKYSCQLFSRTRDSTFLVLEAFWCQSLRCQGLRCQSFTYTSNYTMCDSDPSVAIAVVLFSGGLDCALLARLTNDLPPVGESIDLLNIDFYNPRIVGANPPQALRPYESCPNRVSDRSSFLELRQICPGCQWRFITTNIPYPEAVGHRSATVRLVQPHNTEMNLSITMVLYFAASRRGIC